MKDNKEHFLVTRVSAEPKPGRSAVQVVNTGSCFHQFHWYDESVMAVFLHSVLLIILYCGKKIISKEIFTNSWAVKVRGSQQEAEELALKYGFSYDKHVS